MRRCTRYLFILSVVLFVLPVASQAQLPVYQVGELSRTLVDFPVFITMDETSSLTIDQVAALPVQDRIHPSRFVIPAERANIWLGFRLANGTDKPVIRIVGFDEVHMQNADLFTRENGVWQQQHNGLVVPISQRQVDSRLPMFELKLQPGQTKTIYMMVNSEYNLTTSGITVSSKNQFHRQDRLQNILNSLYLGALGALLLYNLFLFFSLRERVYLFYVAHATLFGLFVTSYSGLAVLAGISAEDFNRFGGFTTLAQSSLLLFTREILKTAQRLPRLDRVLLSLAGLMALLSIMVFLDTTYYKFLVILAMPLMLLQLFLAIHATYRRFEMGKYYLMGTIWYFVGVSILSTLNQGLLPYNLFTRYSFLGGSLLEMIVFSQALAYRIKLLQEQKSAYQEELLLRNETERERLEDQVSKRTAELARANRELESLSRHDGLTGLPNRRYFDNVLEREFQSANRSGKPISVIMCDIDHFKLYNDQLGHQAGDACLVEVAKLIREACQRATDFVARYGGEEFVIVLPDADQDQAISQAERVRQAITSASLEHPANELGRVSMSLGVACRKSNDSGSTAAELVERADRALYESKNLGRDRVSPAAD